PAGRGGVLPRVHGEERGGVRPALPDPAPARDGGRSPVGGSPRVPHAAVEPAAVPRVPGHPAPWVPAGVAAPGAGLPVLVLRGVRTGDRRRAGPRSRGLGPRGPLRGPGG